MKNILFLGGLIKDADKKWGGTIATTTAFLKSFENHPKYNIIFVPRTQTKDIDSIKKILEETEYDILHVDDTNTIAKMYEAGIQPDVIGPITRSPIKKYGNWVAPYTSEFFYNSKIIRLNQSEEKTGDFDYTHRIHFINHGIDTDNLVPFDKQKKYVLWAGDKKRYAKGFPMWEEILENVTLPSGFEFLTLSDYNVEDYWKILDETKILVNTSLYESFCAAMFEAKSKGIPSIYRKNLHNGRHLDGKIQVDYNWQSYGIAINDLLLNEELWRVEAIESREYTVNNFSLKKMAESYSRIYDTI